MQQATVASRKKALPFYIKADVEVSPEELVENFRQFDVDRSGIIDFDEFKRLVLLNIGPKLTDDDIRKMMLTISDTGEINYHQFKSYVERHPEMFHRKLGQLERVFHTLEEPSTSILAKLVSIAVMLFIFISCGAFVIETLPSSNELADDCALGVGGTPDLTQQCKPEPKSVFASIETVCVIVFSIEYALRMSLYQFETTNLALRAQFMGAREIDEDAGDMIEKQSQISTWKRQLNYMTTPMNIVDLISIAPFYVELCIDSKNGVGLTFFRVLRLARVFRIFKMGKYAEGMGMLGKVMKSSAPAFTILLFFAVIGCIFFGALVYFFEAGVYYGPNAMCFPLDNSTCAAAGFLEGAYMRKDILGHSLEVSPFISIPHCFWWVLTTATTVGYGDLYPTSGGGKLIGAITMTLGIVVLALPISVVGANFAAEYNKREREKELDRLLARGDTDDASGATVITPAAEKGVRALGQPMSSAGRSTSASSQIQKIHPTDTRDVVRTADSGNGEGTAAQLKASISQCQATHVLEKDAFSAIGSEVDELERTKAKGEVTGARLDRFLIQSFATISCQAAMAGANPGAAASIDALRLRVLTYVTKLAHVTGGDSTETAVETFGK
jgi:hypothetical protein